MTDEMMERLIDAIEKYSDSMFVVSESIKKAEEVFRELVTDACSEGCIGKNPIHPTIIIRKEEI